MRIQSQSIAQSQGGCVQTGEQCPQTSRTAQVRDMNKHAALKRNRVVELCIHLYVHAALQLLSFGTVTNGAIGLLSKAGCFAEEAVFNAPDRDKFSFTLTQIKRGERGSLNPNRLV